MNVCTYNDMVYCCGYHFAQSEQHLVGCYLTTPYQSLLGVFLGTYATALTPSPLLPLPAPT